MNSETREQLPHHIPVEMAIAPDQKPYEHTHVIHTPAKENKMAQHSLSPEKLGVVGYVKDVAGFVKDVVHDRREKKALARRRSSESTATEQPAVIENTERRKSSAEQYQQVQQQNTAFADAVTGLFPGVNTNASGCTHADELRSQMMHINNEDNANRNNKLL